MKKKLNFNIYIIASLSLINFSCSTFINKERAPSSDLETESLYINKLESDFLKEKLNYLKFIQKNSQNNSLSEINEEIKTTEDLLNQKSSSLTGDSQTLATSELKSDFHRFKKPWRVSKQDFTLHNLDLYKKNRVQTYNLSESSEVTLSLVNNFYSWEHNEGPKNKNTYVANAQGDDRYSHFLNTEFTCTGPYKAGPFKRKAGSIEKWAWYDQFLTQQPSPFFKISRESETCSLRFTDPTTLKTGSVTFIPNTQSILDQFSSRYETCPNVDVSNLTGPEKFFYGSQNNRLTCPVAVSHYKTLPIPQDTIESKIEALTGQKVPSNFWAQKNPFYKFDMSQAPKFDAIFISYLVFRNDLYGRTIAELLKWHASHGTEIYITISKVIELPKDKQMFLDMAAEYPNVHFQEYAYTSKFGKGLKDKFDQLHRTLHSKMFITYSKSNPALRKAWIGGRNIHDGFAFETLPKVSTKEIVDYSKDDSWAFWRDFEAIISDESLIEHIITQYAALWNRDSETQFIRDTVLHVKSSYKIKNEDINLNTPMARHIMTIPFNDNMNLENFISSLIDSAEKEITFSTPYFRPTKALSEAFLRAIDRGVKIKMITRLDLKGDTIDWLLSDVNKAGVNQFLNKIEMYEYTTPNEILHSKVFLVDNKLTFFGGVNLNKRSFYHDIENGVLTLGTDFNSEMQNIFKTYFKNATLISEKQKTKYWKQLLIKAFDKEF